MNSLVLKGMAFPPDFSCLEKLCKGARMARSFPDAGGDEMSLLSDDTLVLEHTLSSPCKSLGYWSKGSM